MYGYVFLILFGSLPNSVHSLSSSGWADKGNKEQIHTARQWRYLTTFLCCKKKIRLTHFLSRPKLHLLKPCPYRATAMEFLAINIKNAKE